MFRIENLGKRGEEIQKESVIIWFIAEFIGMKIDTRDL